MRTFTKGLCSVAGIAFMAGLALLVVGFSMGGHPVGVQLRWDNGPKLVQTTLPRWDNSSAALGTGRNSTVLSHPDIIRNLDFEIGAAKVTLQPGTVFALEVLGDAQYSEEQDGDTWKIKTDTKHVLTPGNPSDVEFIITVPKDWVFETVSFQIGAGQLNASDLVCKNAILSVGAGTMDLNRFTASTRSAMEVGMGILRLEGDLRETITIDCGMGKADFILQRPTSFGYQMNCALGRVSIGEDQFSGLAVEKSHNLDADTLYDVDCGLGSVNITFAV